jgi:hypothetical protein
MERDVVGVIESIPRKAFLLARLDEPDAPPQRATVEHWSNPYSEAQMDAMQSWHRESVEGKPGVRLTMPDGSEWFITDKALDCVLAAVKRSRAYFAAKSD